MDSLTETISVKPWHAFILLAMSGYALGDIIAKAMNLLEL